MYLSGLKEGDFIMTRRTRFLIALFIAMVGLTGLVLAGTGCGDGRDHNTAATKTPAAKAPDAAAAAVEPNAKPYPLKTCVVSGEELGKMGEPFRFVHKGQEIKLCCKGCEKDFNKEPEKFLQKIAAAPGK
jgi:hypothetical protein